MISVYTLMTSDDPMMKLDAKVSMYGALMMISFNHLIDKQERLK